MNRKLAWYLGSMCLVACCGAPVVAADSATPAWLPGTKVLDWPDEDLSSRMMDGSHQFVERKIAEAERGRDRYWRIDATSRGAYEASIAENRQALREILGAVDPRSAPRMERYGDDNSMAMVAETSGYRVLQVRWDVLPGVTAEGLLVQPKQPAVACVVALADADQTPEQLLGLAPGIDAANQFARRLAEQGCEVLVPVLVQRTLLDTTDKQIQSTRQTCREWIYRQAFHMGRHVIGYEVQKVLAAVDWFRQQHGDSMPTGVVGHAEGGLLALYSAALDPRIDAVLVSGYFESRQRVWAEPIYRNIWSLLRRFGDAEIASLVLPRHLVIEHSPVVTIADHKGDWKTPEAESVQSEFRRIPKLAGFPRPSLIIGDGGQAVGPGSEGALREFLQRLGAAWNANPVRDVPVDLRRDIEPTERHRQTVRQLEQHVQSLVRESERIRDQFFLYAAMPELADLRWSTRKEHPVHPAERFADAARAFRERFQTEAMGHFDEPYQPPSPRTRKVAETERWTAYDVVLDVWPEVFAWGVLVVPKDLKPGERRPVVVCQHGRNGLPRDTLDRDLPAYNNFASRLAERGFITFAPHNLYRGEDRYRWLSRKANTIQATLFSFIIAQHDQILRWLDTLPFVDGQRIAFYGLSYGGETAMRVPPVLEKYCLSICSGDFNQWTTKVASTDQPFSFMRTIEWEMPYWNLGQTFDYAEMAYLMVPRPFMVERGHLDLVGRDAWVAHEYAKVRWLYAQLGLADRTEIEYFQGGHSIHGEGTFDFLHRHLDWPAP
ncbi:MAG: dienelactone hydrolase family protein [Pirellulaceae bacterium]|nr:dienelactone hydrolase family protein [Pirellulaceae bacterium]